MAPVADTVLNHHSLLSQSGEAHEAGPGGGPPQLESVDVLDWTCESGQKHLTWSSDAITSTLMAYSSPSVNRQANYISRYRGYARLKNMGGRQFKENASHPPHFILWLIMVKMKKM